MKPKCLILVAGITAALNCSAFGQQDEKLGKLSFPTSCDPKVQAEFERGVAMIHSYWFLIARRTFEGVLRQDPNCAMAYWGIALDLLGNSLATVPPRADAEAAWAALEKARAIGAKTERERDWIEALSAYYRDHDKTPVNARLVAYNKAMEQLAQRYPDDYEAQVFYALTLQASASPADTTYANQLKSAAILEKLYDQNPQHPGVTHFLIHAYDYHPLAEKGIPAARRYAGIAPAVPHARHMPSHIYSMVGLWEELIASNASALEIQPDYYHAADFSVYAHLQLAQDAKAKALTDKSLATADRGDRPITFGNFTAKNAMPARYVLERADWAGAAALPIHAEPAPTGRFPDSFHTRSRNGAHRRSRRRESGDRGHQGSSRRAREVQPVLLGRPVGRTDSRDFGLDRAEGRGARSGAQVHARGGRRRGRQRQARGNGEQALSVARAICRAAARDRPAGCRLERVRDRTRADSQPLPDVLGHCPCRERGWRSPEGIRLLRQAREPREERRYRATGNRGSQGIPRRHAITMKRSQRSSAVGPGRLCSRRFSQR